nr:hypothetical protein [Micromonospora citrea]
MDLQHHREGGREGHAAVSAALAVGDPDPTAVEVDVVGADRHQFGDAHAGEHEGADEHDVAGAATTPHLCVEGAQLLLGGDEWQLLRRGGDLDVEVGAQVSEHLLRYV